MKICTDFQKNYLYKKLVVSIPHDKNETIMIKGVGNTGCLSPLFVKMVGGKQYA